MEPASSDLPAAGGAVGFGAALAVGASTGFGAGVAAMGAGGAAGASVAAGAEAGAAGCGACGCGRGSMSALEPLAIYVCGSVTDARRIRHTSTKRFLLLASRKRNS